MTDDRKPLSPRHDRFVAEYLQDLNATQAYLRAGYAPRCAQANASKLLRQPHIQAAVEAGKRRLAKAMEITVERMAAEYARIAFASVDDFIAVDGDGRVRVDLSKADRAQRAGLLELSVTDYGEGRPQRVKIKLGKLQALDSLARHLGVFVEKPPSGLTPEDRQHHEEQVAAYRRSLAHAHNERDRLEQELREVRAALAATEAKPAEPPPLPDVEAPAPVAPDDGSRADALAKAIWRNHSYHRGMGSAEALRRWAEANPCRPRPLPPPGDVEIEEWTGHEGLRCDD